MTKEFKKYEKDGRIAVIYSPGYGAGWSTWAAEDDDEGMMFDADIVAHVLAKNIDAAKTVAEEKYPDSCTLAECLEIAWMDKGQMFRINEYDGNESIITGFPDYFKA